MPLFDYGCPVCGYEKEYLIRSSTDTVEDFCPNCEVIKLERKVSSANFRLKGTGWYKTDFKHK